MLSIQPIRAGETEALAKYFDALAGVEDYYGDEQELEGYWAGSASATLGLLGVVREGQLIKALQGFDPILGTPIALNAGNGHKPGWDCTFSCPKTVSAVWATADEVTRAAIEKAHRDAVAGAVRFLEQEAIVTRHGSGGAEKVAVAESGGVTCAVFQHSTSRSQDPQLHSHCLVFNFTTDGRGVDLDTRWQSAAGAFYRAELAHSLLAMGYAVERDDIPGREDRPRYFKIAGLPEALVESWSKRREQVLEAKAEWLTDGSTAARFTRQSKDEISREALFRQWAMQAFEHGWAGQGVERLRHAERAGTELSAHDELLGRLTFHDATFSRAALLTAVLEDAQGATSAREALERSKAMLEHADLISLDERTFTTQQMLDLEVAMVSQAAELADQSHEEALGRPFDQFRHLVEQIGAAKGLSEQQMQGLHHITSNHRLTVMQGHAGTGKSYLMGAAREAWQAVGLEVKGIALSNAAARNLGQEAGIPSSSVHALLSGLDAGTVRLTSRTVLVVDEAGMVGTRQMGRLVDAAGAAGAKLVLVGDSQQLQAVEAGGAMAGIMRQTGFVELTEVRRQAAEVDRRIAADLRRGQAGRALAMLQKLDRLHLATDAQAARREAVAAFLRDRAAGHAVLLLAGTNAETRRLNTGVHVQLQSTGEVDTEGVIVKVSQGYREIARGDRLLFREAANLPITGENGGAFRVLNGTLGTVVSAESVANDRAFLAVKLDDGPIVRVDTERYNQLDHGYAMTVNKAQGATVDRVHVLMGAEVMQGKEWSYVAGSRHRHEFHVYTTEEAVLSRNEKSVDLDHSALVQTMSKSRQKDLALDRLAQGMSLGDREVEVLKMDRVGDAGMGLSA